MQVTDLLQRPESPTETVLEMLHEVIDPEVGVNIVDLGLMRAVEHDPDTGDTRIEMTLTTPACPLGPYMEDSIQTTLRQLAWVGTVEVVIVWEPAWEPERDMTDAAKQQLGWM